MMTLEEAKKVLRAALRKAEELGVKCAVAVVDERGWLVALWRMDGAPFPTAEIARDKAWTAAVFRMPSAEIGRFGDPSQPGYGLKAHDWNDRLTTLPGGLPLWRDGMLLGAVGVAGAGEKDLEISQAGADAL